jgi:hypothetical protein
MQVNPRLEAFSRLGRMPRSAAPPLALALGVAAALALASCGGGGAKLLPGETARQITANLDSVKRLAGEGNCVGAEGAARQVSEQIDALGGVDAKLKQALRQGAARLNAVVAGCEATTTEATAPAESEAPAEKPPKKEKKPKKEEAPPAKSETGTTPPPQAKGEGKGPGNGESGGEEGAPPSGGVGPGTPAGEGH